MARIIEISKWVEKGSFELVFNFINETGRCFAFPCNSKGQVHFSTISREAYNNYLNCINGTFEVHHGLLQECVERYRHDAVLECDCGERVILDGFTSTCNRCGVEYNSGGQKLAPRGQWGEETGETLSDIMIGGF